jgi:Putative peptidoglycan binding domain
MSKKIISAALTATTVMWALGMAVVPVAANAQTSAALQAKIAALLAEISQLQGQMSSKTTTNSTTGTTTTSVSTTFTRNLTLGSRGADVSALQQLLINKGFLTAVSAPTGYFGALTRAALGRFQAANSISPAAGYFGPKTKAFVNSMGVSSNTTTTTTTTTTMPAGCTSTAGFSPTTGVSCSSTTTTTTNTNTNTNTSVTAPATGLAVSLASDNPGVGSLVAGSARVPVLAVNFTAGNSGMVTLTGVNFHKSGVVSDSAIGGAYLTNHGKVVAQYNSINQGVISFSGMALQIPAGQTMELMLAIDISSGISNGNTVGFALNAASDITSWDMNNTTIAAAGVFPMISSTFNVTQVSNPALANLTINSSSIGTTVTAGTQANLVGAWSFLGQNSKMWLKGLNFRVIGSANKSDLRNVKLMVNSTQVGATLATVGADGTAYFDGSVTPGTLNTGSNNVQLFADVAGSPSFNFQFEILNSYDVLAIDSQYNVPVQVQNNGGIGTQVNIQQGQITVSQDQSTPTGNIAKGQSQITLAKFDIYAAGEAVKVKFIGFALDFTGAGTNATSTLATQVQNIALTDDAGGQVGTTINQPPSSNACTATSPVVTSSGLNGGSIVSSTVTYVDCFGSASSPINYIIPANTTRVISLKADIQTTANFSNVAARLLGESNNLQGLTSSVTNSGSGATGSALTLALSSLTVLQNNALGNQSVSAGAQNLTIGSYSLTASSAEGVSISNLSIQANSAQFQNLRVMVNGTQFGTTQGTVNAGVIYTFSGSPFTVPAGNTVNVNVVADTLSGAIGTVSPATILTGISGTGLVSNAAISLTTGPVNGQSLTFAGSPAISVGPDSNQVSPGVVTMGSSQNQLAIYRFSETTNVENVKVTDLVVTDTPSTSTAKAAFSNLGLWTGSTLLGTAAPAAAGQTVSTFVVTPAVTGVAATGTITITPTSTATTTNAFQTFVNINGANAFISIGAGIASTTVATQLAAGINTFTSTFQATATSTGGVVTVTSALGNNTPMTLSGTDATPFVFTVNGLHGGVAAVPQVLGTTSTPNGVFTYSFHFATPLIVPQNQSVSATLKGDAATFASAGATDNTGHVFSISSANNGIAVTALGSTSNKPAGVTVANAQGNTQTVLRSTATVFGAPNSFLQTAGKQPSQQIGAVIVTANNAGSIQPRVVKLTFGGNGAQQGSSTLPSTLILKDQQGNDVTAYPTGAATTSTTLSASGFTFTWTFPSSSPLSVSAGGTVALQLWATTNVIPAVVSTGSVVESLSATIQNGADFQYFDGTDNAAFTTGAINLATTTVPVTISALTWGAGQ